MKFSSSEREKMRINQFYNSAQNKGQDGKPIFDLTTIDELITK